MKHIFISLLLLFLVVPAQSGLLHKKKAAESKQTTLTDYIREVSLPVPAPAAPSGGSLFVTGGLLADPYSDFKARKVGDTIAIQISESTTISQSGNVASQRAFTQSSGITGIAGQTSKYLNPLLAANSSSKLTGTGTTDSKSSLNTTLSAQVVAVLPSGSLVVEAQRHVLANQQHESLVLRGVVRPADISSTNTVNSYQLYDLQLEVKGKGVISDSVRQPNIVMRTLMRLLNF